MASPPFKKDGKLKIRLIGSSGAMGRDANVAATGVLDQLNVDEQA